MNSRIRAGSLTPRLLSTPRADVDAERADRAHRSPTLDGSSPPASTSWLVRASARAAASRRARPSRCSSSRTGSVAATDRHAPLHCAARAARAVRRAIEPREIVGVRLHPVGLDRRQHRVEQRLARMQQDGDALDTRRHGPLQCARILEGDVARRVSWNTKPTASAPALTAASIASSVRRPQILIQSDGTSVQGKALRPASSSSPERPRGIGAAHQRGADEREPVAERRDSRGILGACTPLSATQGQSRACDRAVSRTARNRSRASRGRGN